MKQTEQEQLNIAALVESVRGGDPQAFERLYKQTVFAIRSVCSGYFQNTYDIDEAVQETYVRIFRSIQSLHSANAFSSWSRTIARNTCLNMIRSRNLVSAHETLFESDFREEDVSEKDVAAEEYRKDWNPEAVMENRLKERILHEIMDSISDIQRSCILLWAEGYTYQNIAQKLGMPAGSVKSTIHYTRKKITHSILRMEKEQGIRLHSMAPIPYFLWLLEQNNTDQGTASAASGTSAAAELSSAETAGFAAVMEELARHGLPDSAGYLSGSLLTGKEGVKAHTVPAFLAAAVLLLAILFPVGTVLAASMSDRIAPQDISMLSDPVRAFHVSELAAGSQKAEAGRDEGIGAEQKHGETLQQKDAAATVEIAVVDGGNGADDASKTVIRSDNALHSGRSDHPDHEQGHIRHSFAKDRKR